MPFDPDGVTTSVDGLFGLPSRREDARVVVIPAPFDATASYGAGSAEAPDAIRRASNQIDLYDIQFGRIYDAGIFMEHPPAGLRDLSIAARRLAEPILRKGEPTEEDRPILDRIDELCAEAEALARDAAAGALADGKIPATLGGEHPMALGGIRACAERLGSDTALGVLQIDAHMDLHPSYGGMRYSHASVIRNALEMIPSVRSVVQVGVRDFAERELNYARASEGRVTTFFDLDLWKRREAGVRFADQCAEIIDHLPETVYVTFDIDGLDPSLCPRTGTPAPGGLSFHEACILLEALSRSTRTIVGFDLCEAAPAPTGADEWDANVGARVLYKLCGAATAQT